MTDKAGDPENALILAPLGRDADVAATMLTRAGLNCTTGHDLGDLEGVRLEDLSTIVLTEELLTAEGVQTLTALLETQAAWSNLPVILLIDQDRRRIGINRANELEAFCTRVGVILLQRPMYAASFASVLRSTMLARRKQYELRDTLEAHRMAEERATTLAEEMKHRVKNAFAVAASIASQTFRTSETTDGARQTLSGRLASMAQAQDLVFANGGGNADLRSLVEQVLEPYGNSEERDRIELAGPDVNVNAQAATAIAMALHELSTNALKYGALSVASGRVSIGWRTGNAEAGVSLIVQWRESGGPPVSPPQRRGFGSLLVEQSLAYDLNGSAQMDFRPEGLVCTIRAAISN